MGKKQNGNIAARAEESSFAKYRSMRETTRREFCVDVVATSVVLGYASAVQAANSGNDLGGINFPEMPVINKSEIKQTLLNIENKTRSNLFAWNGQFSPQFIEVLLKHYAKEGDFVVDPFLGAGTVLGECARLGLRSYGIELNASAYLMAKTYELVNIELDKRKELIDDVDSFINTISLSGDDKVLDELVLAAKSAHDERKRILLSTLVVLLDVYNNVVSCALVITKWNGLKRIVNQLPYSRAKITAEMGDARCLSLADNSVDLIITSPPYINVFNYHQKYRRSVEMLGYDVLKIARSEFGSNRKNRGNRFLTVIQYCIDMALAMHEAVRVCRKNARLIYVVGRESKVLGVSFCNSELIFWIATKILGLKCVLRQERVFKNRFGQMIKEDILHFVKVDDESRDLNEVENAAREIAVAVLRQKRTANSSNKNVVYIDDALQKSSTVTKSEE